MRSSKNEDRALVKKLLAGDAHAFERFFDTYFPRLMRFVATRLKGHDHWVEEVVQASLCKAVQHLHAFRGEASLFTWMCTICRRELSRLRTEQKLPVFGAEPFEERPEIQAALESLGRVSQDPEQETLRQEIVRLVHLTLDHLKPRHAEILRLKYLKGQTVKEIAGQLQLGCKAVESRLTRARMSFRDGFASLTRDLPDGFTAIMRRRS